MSWLTLRTVSLIVGWMHIIFSAAVIGFMIYLGVSTNIYQRNLQIGLLVFILYFTLNVACMTIAVLLVKGILRESRSLMAPFIYGQCMLITFCVCFIAVDVLWKLTNRGTLDYTLFGFVVDCAHVVITSVMFYPVLLLYRKMRLHAGSTDRQDMS